MDREKCEYLNVVVTAWWNQFYGDDLDEEIKTKIIKNKKKKNQNPVWLPRKLKKNRNFLRARERERELEGLKKK